MKFKFNEGRMFADIDDGLCVIIDAATGTYYGMDGESSSVFNALCYNSVEAIIEHVEKKYNKDVSNELKSFADDLKSKGILIDSVDGEDLNELNLDLTTFKWKCQAYTDAQDLILADPIHDVSAEEGWSPVIK